MSCQAHATNECWGVVCKGVRRVDVVQVQQLAACVPTAKDRMNTINQATRKKTPTCPWFQHQVIARVVLQTQ